MRYCLNYKSYKDKEYKDVDELKIKYNPDDKSLFDFLQKYKDKVINIYVSAAQLQDKSNIRLFKGFIAKGCTNFKLIITFMQDNRENVDALKAEKFLSSLVLLQQTGKLSICSCLMDRRIFIYLVALVLNQINCPKLPKRMTVLCVYTQMYAAQILLMTKA